MKKISPFIDYHLHPFVDGRECSGKDMSLKIISHLIETGIFSFYEMGSRGGMGLELKRIHGSMNMAAKSAGIALYKEGCYGSFLGTPICGTKDIKDAIAKNVSSGADFIKVINSGIVSANPNVPVSGGGFSSEELRLIVDIASDNGMDVRCHANSDDAIRDAAFAGVKSIEHGYFIKDDTIQLIAENRIEWTPTIFALHSYRTRLSDIDKGKYLDSVLERHMESVYKAHELGVVIRAGTDSGAKGVRHGEAFIEELRLLHKSGLSLDSILSSSTLGWEQAEKGNYLIISEDFLQTGQILETHQTGLIGNNK